MSGGKVGRGFAALPLEEQVRALRDPALGQELVIAVLFTAVERLGVTFVWPGDEDADERDAGA